ncbi:hypothetical protein DITRI_Ditri05aG0068200 [Diplodiscus trichospermus]
MTSQKKLKLLQLFGAKANYKLVRDKELYFSEHVRELFEKDRANRDGAERAKEKVRRWQVEQDLNIDDIDEMQMNNQAFLDQENYTSCFTAPSPMAQASQNFQDNASSVARQSNASSKGTKRKQSDIIANEIKEVTSSMKEMAHAITKNSKRIYMATEITNELKKLGMDTWETMEALDFYKITNTWYKGFLHVMMRSSSLGCKR